MLLSALLLHALSVPAPPQEAAPPVEVSGVYPRLAVHNDENECGIGGVVAWADRLWVLTYAPHRPRGSSDKLWSIDRDLNLTAHPASVGGTPACRMIHEETQQLVLGPYVIDAAGAVRVVPPERMPGRLTGVARHLTEPERKVYVATMEEGLYELDLVTLEVTELYADDQGQLGGRESERRVANLPGYHGKGLYSGQGRLVYANNGEPGPEAQRRPDVPSGCLAEWDGESWRVVRRNQFTEVTGPGSLRGNADPANDPVWALGWDHRSVLLMLLDDGEWSTYRLPKASHSYDGAHGWNTEWPRIRDVGLGDALMTMHGTLWRFPKTFAKGSTAGIRPLSTYLKVVGDVARFGDRIVLGCDDVARSEFLNTRRAKGALQGPGRSHSNLRFLEPEDLERMGPRFGRGAVWIDEPVAANTWSDPFLVDGYATSFLHFAYGDLALLGEVADATAYGDGESPRLELEIDRDGDGNWETVLGVGLPGVGGQLRSRDLGRDAVWMRARVTQDVEHATLTFTLRDEDPRGVEPAPRFDGLARVEDEVRLGGLLRSRGDERGTLAVVAQRLDGEGAEEVGLYALTEDLQLVPNDDAEALAWHRERLTIPTGVVQSDAASLLYVDDDGRRWRLPRVPGADPGPARVCREVATERDLFHAGGLLYELPARNAGGFAKLRPVAAHPFRLHDFAAHRGLLVMTGVRPGAEASSHLVRSADGRAAVWVGEVDDLWSLGRPRGVGGPWMDTPALKGVPSDPFLVSGFGEARLALEHDGDAPARFDVQLDLTGTGVWVPCETFRVEPGERREEVASEFGAYWLRVVVDADVRATAQLEFR